MTATRPNYNEPLVRDEKTSRSWWRFWDLLFTRTGGGEGMPSVGVVPTGGIIENGAAGTPNEFWLVCDGSDVSRTTYDDLFAVIGTTYGAGDGSTTFGLPTGTGTFGDTLIKT